MDSADVLMSVCFPEPEGPDDTVGRRRESLSSFLGRSTWDRAAEMRAFYNDALTALPAGCGDRLCQRLRRDDPAATFEMIVGRFLQLRGASDLECEPGGRGRRVDWRAVFPDGTVHVEAMVPLYNARAGTAMRQRARLLDYIEERAPKGWWLWPSRFPKIGESAPLGAYKQLVDELLSRLPPSETTPVEERRELLGRLPEGELRIGVVRTAKDGGLATEGGIAYMDNSELRVKIAWADKRKRKQGRSVPPPALLAIQGSFGGADLEDFENALFGRDVRLGRDPDGVMATDRNPPWAGVLAVPEVSPAGARDPVVFLSPWCDGGLPRSIERLEVRTLANGKLLVREAQDREVMSTIRWAKAR